MVAMAMLHANRQRNSKWTMLTGWESVRPNACELALRRRIDAELLHRVHSGPSHSAAFVKRKTSAEDEDEACG